MDNTEKTKSEKIADCEEFVRIYAIYNQSENNFIQDLISEFLHDTYKFAENFDIEGYAIQCKNITELQIKINSLQQNPKNTGLVNYLKTELDKLLNEI